jgi:hypothetical protein
MSLRHAIVHSLLQPGLGEGADRYEQAISVGLGDLDDERLLNQAGQKSERPISVNHRFDGRDGEAAGKYLHAAQETPFDIIEKLVAPVDSNLNQFASTPPMLPSPNAVRLSPTNCRSAQRPRSLPALLVHSRRDR